MERIVKYPRTPHLSGSKLQEGDEDLAQIPFSQIAGKVLVVEEKVDGANAAISFSEDGKLLLQSRGHFLTGGFRERHYDLFKVFAAEHQAKLYDLLGKRYILYGEWLYAKHKVYYDALPAYFLEFDIFDREQGVFLDTPTRQKMLQGAPVQSAPVLKIGRFKTQKELLFLLGKSLYVTEQREENLRLELAARGIPAEEVLAETDLSGLAEGLYIKVEENGQVINRLKFVRYGYTQVKPNEEKNWLAKPIIPNKLTEK
jgi:hypothetical protein